ncbi:helicase-related protein [Stenoxybacter acetivorans]|uniref:helicase-related protein n=1 Tax=Stenoxybacter acetivorans TaxID=422441 RepID=UPI0012EC1B64|nr:helicase-related protein [Stenoxybacter acetivorans]
MNPNEIREQMIGARKEYINLIKSELIGPGSEFSVPNAEHELISSSPISRYSIGILYPQGNQVNQDSDETVPLNADESENDETEDIDDVSPQTDDASANKPTQKREREFDETAEENLDEEIGLSAQYMPSSMGITFTVKGTVDVVRCKVVFATYRNAKVPDCIIPFTPDDPDNYSVPSALVHKMGYDKKHKVMRLTSPITAKEIKEILEKGIIPENEFAAIRQIAYRFVDFCRNGYIREPHTADCILDFSQGDYIDNNKKIDGTTAKVTALRTKISDEVRSLTIMLVNDFAETPAKAHHCIFQPKIEISSENNDFIFYETDHDSDIAEMDEEERSLELLYRKKKMYGTGLGVSVDWNIDTAGKGGIWSEFFPQAEVPPMSFDLPKNDTVTAKDLSMKYLSDLNDVSKSEKLLSLKNIVDLYKSWVDTLETTASALDIRYKSAASKNISECKRAYKRMYAGVETLSNNSDAYSAFTLANRAMFMQRIHLKLQSDTSNIDRYPGDEQISELLRYMNYREISDDNCHWRPFQVAFLLMDINSITDDESPERDIVDLIWFPTGGGKTEAYLGLTAFTIFYRRLTHLAESGGTSVIMRYTLRLLAAQQFTRAATLICACEFIRKDCEAKQHTYPDYPLGKEPITIGLWIGGTHIPNRNEDAKYHLEKLLNVREHYYVRNEKDRHNKFQVLKCPWCGTKLVKDDKDKTLIGKWGYAMRDKYFYMFCPQEDCDFTSRLPIQIIDEELYRNPPTLLFGTVDKFAMLPWDGRIGAFFAAGTNNRAPELIIQDELHLISGALGTMVGLYETAVDAICGQKGVKPKIIASTATIRRAKEQCSVLYNREVVQFPSPGLNAEDSFFAREATVDYERGVFGRRYVGIMPSGKTKAMTEIRAMAALLQKANTMSLSDEVKDKLWTLTVYFNSLKDLGKASTLVDDDVKDFIVRTANRMFTSRRLIVGADELTSRVTTTELNETLDKLEKLEYSRENINDKRYASNVLLATNMISVGIDVARLNVMLMVGQPKLTSEYIQASSRIGRSFPGVAFVQYDATKSRDRSHYERFRAYHESFYRFVEPTGATPFSKPARERALHAVLTAMLRQRTGLKEDKDAANFDREYFADDIDAIKTFIIERIRDINIRADNRLKDDIDDVKVEIDAFFDEWQKTVQECNETGKTVIPFYFGRKYMVKPPYAGERRLLRPYNSAEQDYATETLISMRNVDSQVRGRIVIWEDKTNG